MDIYSQSICRNSLSASDQSKIRKTTVAVVGLGGTGGFAFENLIRLGFEKFILFESDRFDLTNFNRQLYATLDSLDGLKSEAALKRAALINPNASIRINPKFDSKSPLFGAKIVVDCSDNVPTKIFISDRCKKAHIPYVFCASNDSRGIVSVFKSYSFRKAFNLPKSAEKHESYKTCSSILCPAAAIAGSLGASCVLSLVLKKPLVTAPDAIFFNLFAKEPFWRAKLG
ncbi:ThiF family adenylyltransferase [Candidatus Micrarchaeota archaeon]|nr:ThiF family adenylyltransferase [Candidatus Micrarchaeota archaeon]